MNGIIVVIVIIFILITISFLYLNLESRFLRNELELQNVKHRELQRELAILIINKSKYNEYQRIGDLFIISILYNCSTYEIKYKTYNERTTRVVEMSEFEIDNYTSEICS